MPNLILDPITAHNQKAWDAYVNAKVEWTIPTPKHVIDCARNNQWDVHLTPTKAVPKSWLGDIAHKRLLCLACGGGQQGPVFAAAGAQVTVFDLSENQLAQDQKSAKENGLALTTVQGDMRNLSCFEPASFDLIFHPVSNTFVNTLQPVWNECYRVLAPGGTLCAGFTNPMLYIFDPDQIDEGRFDVKFRLPYRDDEQLSPTEQNALLQQGRALEFSHTFETQINGQIQAGFSITGFYEDGQTGRIESDYFPMYFATKATKQKE